MSGFIALPILALAAATFYLVEGWVTGWFRLRRTYPADNARVIRTHHFSSGELGWLWQFKGMLTLGACDRGLMVSTWLRPPFVVPWREIHVEQAGGLVRPMVQLVFGRPEVGRLRIAATTWDEVAADRPAAS